MASVNVNLNFIATGNFAPLHKQITALRGAAARIGKVNSQIAGSTAVAGKAAAASVTQAAAANQLFADSTVRARGPLEMMTRAIERQRVGLATLARTMKVSRTIIHQHIITVRAQREAYLQAAGGAKVSTQAIMQKVSALKVATMQIRMFNTLMVALGRTMIRVGKNIQWAGRQIMVGIGIPLAILGTVANRAAEEYIREMTRVVKVTNFTAASGTVAFEKQEESVRRQTKAIADLGASMGFLAEESAKTVAEFAQMGFVGRALDSVAETALRLSFTAGADLDTSIQMTRIAAQAFNIDLQDLTETFARLNLVENNTALSLAELALALPVVAGVANGVGLSIEQTSGFLAVMKENGVSAKEGATALRTGLIRLVQDATDPAREAFQNIGIDLDKLNQKVKDEGGDIMVFFDTLGRRMATLEREGGQAAVNDFTAAIGKLTGTRQAARFLGLVDEIPNMIRATEVANKALNDALDDGADYVTAFQAAKDAMNEASDGLADTAGARAAIATWTDATVALAQYEREQQAIADSAAGIAKRLRAQIQMELVGIGDETLQIANAFREFILRVLRGFNELGEGTRKGILAFSVFALGLGAVIMTLGLLMNMFGNVTSAIFSLLPGLRGKNKLMTEGQAAEAAATQALNAAISQQNALLKINLSLKQGKIPATTASTTATAANTTATQANAAATGAATAATTKWTIAKGIGAKASAAKNAVVNTYTASVARSNYVIRGTGIAAGVASKFLSVLQTAFILTGKAAMIMGKMVLKAFAFTGIGAIIIALIAAIIIMFQNWGKVSEGFGEVAGNAIQRVVDIFVGFWEVMKNTFAAGQQGIDGTSEAAMTLGEAIGHVFNAFMSVLEFVINRVGPLILGVVSSISQAVGVITNIINGDFSAAWEGIKNILRTVGQSLYDFLISPFRRLLEAVATFDNAAGRLAQKALDGLSPPIADAAREAGELRRRMKEYDDILEKSSETQRTLNVDMKSAQDIKDDLVKWGIISADITLEEAKAANLLTDEQHEQLIIAEKYPDIVAGGNAILAEKAEIIEIIRQLEHEILNANEAQALVLQGELEAAQDRLNKTAERYDSFVSSSLEGLEKYRRPIRGAAGAMEDLNFEADEFNEALNEGVNNAKRLVNLLRQAVGNLTGDIVTAVNNIYRAQSRAIEDAYKDLADQSKAFFRKFADDKSEVFRRMREDIESQFNRELDHLKEVEEAEVKRLEKVRDEMEEQEKMRERFFAAERARIDFLSGREIARIETSEALARGDLAGAAIIRIQQEASERQFVLGLLDEERKTFFDLKKEQLEAEIRKAKEERELAEKTLTENKDAALDAVQAAEDAYDDQAEAAEAAADAAIESALEAAKKAQEAEEIRVRNYLREWQEVTPATEEEYQQHLAKLNRFLDKSGSRMTTQIDRINKRLNRELQDISNNFGVETDSISADLGAALDDAGHMSVDLLRHIDMISGTAFLNVANSALIVADGVSAAFVSAEALTVEFLRWFEESLGNGFQNASNRALRRMLEDDKWAKAGKAAGDAFRKAYENAAGGGGGGDPKPDTDVIPEDAPLVEIGHLSAWEREVMRRTGIDLTRNHANIESLGFDPARTQRNFERFRAMEAATTFFAKGGIVTKPIFPAVVGEAGPEAIIPLNQIDKVFGALVSKKFMGPIRGMVMDQSRELISAGAGANYNLAFNIYDANIDEDKLARKVMFEIDRANRNTGGGRTVRMV